MKNNGGWGLQIMLVFCIILILGLVVSFSIIQNRFSSIAPDMPINSLVNYQDVEVTLVNSAKRYINEFYKVPLQDTTDLEVTVSVEKLKQEGFLKSLKDPKNKKECSGYVLFKKIDNHLQYQAYISCGSNYTTNGYDAKYENS